MYKTTENCFWVRFNSRSEFFELISKKMFIFAVKFLKRNHMKLYYKIVVIVLAVVFTSCQREKDVIPDMKLKQMIMSLKASGTVEIAMAGNGSATIDWGDNSEIKTHQFSSGYSFFEHEYSDSFDCIITITGVCIEGLICNKINLNSLDVSDNIALVSLFCDHNLLADLNVSKNIALTSLSCDHNKLKTLDLSKNSKLTTLWCHENLLEVLEVVNNKALTKLNCGYNRLTKLDVSKNLLLRELYCDGNKLENLDVNNNAFIRELDCSDNLLKNLVVSNISALILLNCSWNELTNLNVNSNILLTELNCSRNLIESLNMTNNTALTELYCGFNRLEFESLNKLFETMHDKTISRGKSIYIFWNPGMERCNMKLATEKGWRVE